MGNPSIDGPAKEEWPNETEGERPPTKPETGEPPMSNPEPSGEMKRMKLVMTAEGYGTTEKEWLVPEELLRPYAIAYDAALSAVGLEISKAIYDKLIDEGLQGAETLVAKEMMAAAGKVG